jgi:hypothetical protein
MIVSVNDILEQFFYGGENSRIWLSQKGIALCLHNDDWYMSAFIQYVIT